LRHANCNAPFVTSAAVNGEVEMTLFALVFVYIYLRMQIFDTIFTHFCAAVAIRVEYIIMCLTKIISNIRIHSTRRANFNMYAEWDDRIYIDHRKLGACPRGTERQRSATPSRSRTKPDDACERLKTLARHHHVASTKCESFHSSSVRQPSSCETPRTLSFGVKPASPERLRASMAPTDCDRYKQNPIRQHSI